MLVTELGISMSVKPVHPKKAPEPMASMLSPKMYVETCEPKMVDRLKLLEYKFETISLL